MATTDFTPNSVDIDYFPHTNNLFVVSRLANFGYGKIFVYHTGSFSEVQSKLNHWHSKATTISDAIQYLKECGFTQISSHPKE